MQHPMIPIVIAIMALVAIAVSVVLFVNKKKRRASVRSFTGAKKKFTLSDLFSKNLNEAFYAELEARLLAADTGIELTKTLVTELRNELEKEKTVTPESAKERFRTILLRLFVDEPFAIDGKTLLFIIGVNGVGKTTTIAKLANRYKNAHTTLLVAADTFRAGAIEQLDIWARRIGVPIVKGQEGGDPASVLFDALTKAQNANIDLVIADTAGRFHNKEHLMRELAKMKRIAVEKFPSFKFIPLLAIDTNVGQNGFEQAKLFLDELGAKGAILAKFDATGKGGIAFAINTYLSLPIFFVGTGETLDDISAFDKRAFVASILDE